MLWVKVHRWLAIVLVAFLVVWSVTGLLFHLKPGWDRAYDMLSVERPHSKVERFDTAIGPLQRTSTANGAELHDANTGARRVLTEQDVRVLVADAIARSPHAAAYGDVATVTLADGTARVTTRGGPVIEVGLDDARLSQRGPDTDRIDWLYRIHYLQWTGHKTLDRILAVLGLALIWAVMVPGIWLFVRRFRRVQ